MSKNKWRDRMIAEGRCNYCGCKIVNSPSKNYCGSCYEKLKTKINSRRNKIRMNLAFNTCYHCFKHTENPGGLCNSCKKYHSNYQRERYKLWKEQGLCCECGKEKLKNALVCEKHYFMRTAHRALGTPKKWKDIKSLFLKQNGKCFYTGIKLILGVNASIDHKNPKCRGGVNDINNLVFCDAKINSFKEALTAEELINMCKKIVNNLTDVEGLRGLHAQRNVSHHGR